LLSGWIVAVPGLKLLKMLDGFLLLLPVVSAFLPCRNTLLQHPRTRSCMSSSVPLDSGYGVTPFSQLKGLFIQGPIFISFFLA
ncbi:hypothetical protein ABKV19_017254, partial [Rosa sericea]